MMLMKATNRRSLPLARWPCDNSNRALPAVPAHAQTCMGTLDDQIEYYNKRWTQEQYANLYSLERCIFFLESLLATELERPRICDLGCGTGWLTSVLNAFGPAVGVELSPEAVAHAKQKYPNATFIAGDITAWEPDPGSFDVAVSQEVIEHIADKPAYLAVARRALRDGGYLFMTTPNLRVLDALPTEERKSIWEIQPVELPLDRSQLTALLSSAGFKVISTGSLVDGVGRRGIHRLVNSAKLRMLLRTLRLHDSWKRYLNDHDFGMYMTTVAQVTGNRGGAR
jgi:SAM-dependent methyltransferase